MTTYRTSKCGCNKTVPSTKESVLKSRCDCCVIPFQNLLRKIENEANYTLQTIGGEEFAVSSVNSISNFIFDINDEINMVRARIPICMIGGAVSLFQVDVNLQSSIKSTGECACCEDPSSDSLKSFLGEEVSLSILGRPILLTQFVLQVGEGIVKVGNDPDAPVAFSYFSTCAITSIQTPL
ncbi:hypothetical protein [Cytobacillus sp. IB215665]|uniref:hypothetical protein n=1 Tax=Cytobacillus sp. IB215665 TaxID=3097357 RepID=UPI002A15C005|nr:hypothetical protein [Cytobacillus sp. IB215665]MDX8365500.1 hypothetical protein [Cytobacillus sp. IB215665]